MNIKEIDIGSIPLFIISAKNNIYISQIKGCGDRDYFLLGNFKNWDAPIDIILTYRSLKID
jgi:hypothetical protein